MKRLLELKSPPVVGEKYLVPVTTINGHAGEAVAVLGVEHADPELEQSTDRHIHLDLRFVSDDRLSEIGFSCSEISGSYRSGVPTLRTEQLHDKNRPWEGSHFVGPPSPLPEKLQVWEEVRECIREIDHNNFTAGYGNTLRNEAVRIKESGVKGIDLKCAVCPHKGTPLNHIKPRGNIIACPAHGMKFDATTGEII